MVSLRIINKSNADVSPSRKNSVKMENLCCMHIYTAGVVFGWLGLVGSLVMTVLLCVILGEADQITNDIINSKDEYDDLHLFIIVMGSILLGITAINLLCSGLLILGTMKERHLMLLPWLINSGLSWVIWLIYDLTIFSFIVYKSYVDLYPVLIVLTVKLILELYIYFGIYSLYKKIQQSSEQQRPLIDRSQDVIIPTEGNSYTSYTQM